MNQTHESEPKFQANDRVVVTGGNVAVGQEGFIRYYSQDDNYVAVRMNSGEMLGFSADQIAQAQNPANAPADPQNPSVPGPDATGLPQAPELKGGGTTAEVKAAGESEEEVSDILSRKPQTFKRVLESFEKDRKY